MPNIRWKFHYFTSDLVLKAENIEGLADHFTGSDMYMYKLLCHYDNYGTFYMGHYDEYIVCIIMASLSDVLFREINRVSRILLITCMTTCTCKLIMLILTGR